MKRMYPSRKPGSACGHLTRPVSSGWVSGSPLLCSGSWGTASVCSAQPEFGMCSTQRPYSQILTSRAHLLGKTRQLLAWSDLKGIDKPPLCLPNLSFDCNSIIIKPENSMLGLSVISLSTLSLHKLQTHYLIPVHSFLAGRPGASFLLLPSLPRASVSLAKKWG